MASRCQKNSSCKDGKKMHWEHASLVGNTSLHMIYEQLIHPHNE